MGIAEPAPAPEALAGADQRCAASVTAIAPATAAIISAPIHHRTVDGGASCGIRSGADRSVGTTSSGGGIDPRLDDDVLGTRSRGTRNVGKRRGSDT